MTPLVQACIVVATLAFVALVVTTIRALVNLGRSAAELTSAAQLSMTQVERIVLETQELLASVREILPPAQRVIHRFERLGERAANLSSAMLDEIETPLFSAVAVARGVKIGTARLFDLLASRVAPHRTTHNGDHDHE
jgi:uncharacterized protein YoxC